VFSPVWLIVSNQLPCCLGEALPHQQANGPRAHPNRRPKLPLMDTLKCVHHIRISSSSSGVPVIGVGYSRVTHVRCFAPGQALVRRSLHC